MKIIFTSMGARYHTKFGWAWEDMLNIAERLYSTMDQDIQGMEKEVSNG